MKRILFVAAFLPALAFAQVKGSKHDFSTTGPNAAIKSATQTQTCVYCHAPHGGDSAGLLWNRAYLPANGSFSWGTNPNTVAGTVLPASLTMDSLRCLSCHDGSQAIGAMKAAPEVGFTAKTSGLNTVTSGATNNVLGGNHPVSIPYAGQVGTYNGKTSAAVIAAGQYIATATGAVACSSPSGVCTAEATNGKFINLKKDITNPAVYGVECTTCHDPHASGGTAANGFLLRAPAAGSALCLACHNK